MCLNFICIFTHLGWKSQILLLIQCSSPAKLATSKANVDDSLMRGSTYQHFSLLLLELIVTVSLKKQEQQNFGLTQRLLVQRTLGYLMELRVNIISSPSTNEFDSLQLISATHGLILVSGCPSLVTRMELNDCNFQSLTDFLRKTLDPDPAVRRPGNEI